MIVVELDSSCISEFKRENPLMGILDALKAIYGWCNENCVGKWDSDPREHLTLYFELESDAVAFKLRWL